MKDKRFSVFTCIIFISICIMTFFIAHLLRFIRDEYLGDRLINAIMQRDASDTEMFLQKGADPNRKCVIGLSTDWPIEKANASSDLKIMTLLIKYGVDVNHRSEVTSTPLMDTRSPQIAQMLLDAGANPFLKDNAGYTALQFAIQRKLPEVEEVLRRAETRQESAIQSNTQSKPQSATDR